jgi:hypothetical protein
MCAGMGGGESASQNLSEQAPLYGPAGSLPVYREPLYTAEETRVVRTEAELEKVLNAGGAVKRVIFQDFYVRPAQFGRLVALFGASLECIEMSGGEGYQLDGESVRAMAAACPKLRKVREPGRLLSRICGDTMKRIPSLFGLTLRNWGTRMTASSWIGCRTPSCSTVPNCSI